MRQNNKGYMLVELVLASVLAITIALYLLNLTYQFKNKNDDIYQSLTYSSDKIAITKNIMTIKEEVIYDKELLNYICALCNEGLIINNEYK